MWSTDGLTCRMLGGIRASLFTTVMLIFVFCLSIFAEANDAQRPKRLIIVGGNSAYPPYEYLDREGKPAGFVVDLTRAIAEVMGFEVKIVLGTSWMDMRDALERGDVDVLQGISYSEKRDRMLDFSPPHSFVSHSIFAHRHAKPVHSIDELQGKNVIVMGRGIMHDIFASGSSIKPVPEPTVADALKVLSTGQYDYAVLATLPAIHTMADLGISDVETVSRGIDTKKYCYAVKEGNREVLNLFIEGMNILKASGKYHELQSRWLPTSETHPWVARHGWIIVVMLFLGLAVTIFWSHSLKQQVALRTAALEREVEKRKRAAEELRNNQQQLVQADKMAALGILVSGMAHEINNPNGLILLNLPTVAEAARDVAPILEKHYEQHGDFRVGGLPYSQMRKEMPHILREMQQASTRIKRIVEDLKHFSRRSDARYDDLIDVNEVVKTSVRLVDNTLRKATNRYTVQYAGQLPFVRGNFQRLEQVVVNLVLNACQALESPDKAIKVSTRYHAETRSVIIEIADEGVGISPEHLARMTEPFFTTKRQTGGTGLGLAISDGIITEHGGKMRFESIPGIGTTVIVTLPAADGEDSAGVNK